MLELALIIIHTMTIFINTTLTQIHGHLLITFQVEPEHGQLVFPLELKDMLVLDLITVPVLVFLISGNMTHPRAHGRKKQTLQVAHKDTVPLVSLLVIMDLSALVEVHLIPISMIFGNIHQVLTHGHNEQIIVEVIYLFVQALL